MAVESGESSRRASVGNNISFVAQNERVVSGFDNLEAVTEPVQLSGPNLGFHTNGKMKGKLTLYPLGFSLPG